MAVEIVVCDDDPSNLEGLGDKIIPQNIYHSSLSGGRLNGRPS